MNTNILFLHIPKTAGQSAHEYLVNVFGKTNVCPARVNDQLRQYSVTDFQKYKVFSGHFDWNLLDPVSEPKFTFTILRDPIERIVSFYLYLRREAEKLDAQALDLPRNSGKRAILSLTPDEYFAAPDIPLRNFIDDHYDNFYTYYFSGRAFHARSCLLASFSPDLSQQERESKLIKLSANNLILLNGIYAIHTWQQRLSEDLWSVTGLERVKTCPQERIFNINKGDSLDLDKRLCEMRNLGATELTFSTILKFVSLDKILFDEYLKYLEINLSKSLETLAKYAKVTASVIAIPSSATLTKESKDSEIEYLVSQAKTFHTQGDWQKSVDCLTQILKLQEDNWEVQQLLGDALLNLEKWEDAANTYRRALKLNPEFDWTYYNLAVALKKLGRFEEASTHYQKLAEIWGANQYIPEILRVNLPENFDPEMYLELNPDVAEQVQGDLYKASLHFLFYGEQENRSYNVDLAKSYLNKATILLRMGRMEEGIYSLYRAIEIEPYNSWHSVWGGSQISEE